MSDERFNVLDVRSETVRDKRGNFVRGFVVEFSVAEFGEIHSITISEAERHEVQQRILDFIEWRRGLNK